eukprot:6994768-Prymnesium_polylepis.1
MLGGRRSIVVLLEVVTCYHAQGTLGPCRVSAQDEFGFESALQYACDPQPGRRQGRRGAQLAGAAR